MSSKRPAKRSILGLRVAAKRDTGFYDAATVTDTTSKQVTGPAFLTGHGASADKYLLKFDDGFAQWYLERQIIGQGFQAITSACLSVGQLVYCTVGHREIPARITKLPAAGDELFQLDLEDGSGRSSISRKQEDMRLIKSRKSARITADKDKDYHSLALGKTDVPLESLPELPAPSVSTYPSGTASRKRAVPLDIIGERSNQITVASIMGIPSPLSPKLYRDSEAYESLEGDYSDESNLGADDAGHDVQMDECSAALVLMSLGASSPAQSKVHDETGFLSTSCPSMDLYGHSWPSAVARTHPLTGRPISPASLHDSNSTTTSSSDEGIETASSSVLDPCHLDHDYSAWPEPTDWSGQLERPRKRRPSNSVIFQCTWPKCQHKESTRAGVKRHIHNVHFTSAGLPAEDLEFYYNEIDDASPHDSLSPATPPSEKRAGGIHARGGMHLGAGHSRQRSTLSASSDLNMASRYSRLSSSAKPINIPRIIKRREWESTSAPHSGHSDGVSFGSSPGSRLKNRDVKKCRKVYGMEHREMWCTQCKWKKACTRFAEQ